MPFRKQQNGPDQVLSRELGTFKTGLVLQLPGMCGRSRHDWRWEALHVLHSPMLMNMDPQL